MALKFVGLSLDYNNLAIILSMLVLVLLGVIWQFSRRYMAGDVKLNTFYMHLSGLACSLLLVICADHLVLLWLGYSCSNACLVRLMLHKASWRAALGAARHATKNFLLVSVTTALAFYLLYAAGAQCKISAILSGDLNSTPYYYAACLLVIAAIAQSAIWPSHHWLLSSLNSPTPVSAIMHAGLINGGGLLLVRFAQLFHNYPVLLKVIFSFGVLNAILGTAWKLIQNDNKRMLACSTMAQMGFMFMQCGLGCFSAAVAHCCWHGFFKAYLFLNSGSAAQVQAINTLHKPRAIIAAIAVATSASYVFAKFSMNTWLPSNASWCLTIFAWIAAFQGACICLADKSWQNFILSCCLIVGAAFLYGNTIGIVHFWLAPLKLDLSQPLDWIYILGIIILISFWFAGNFVKFWFAKNIGVPVFILRWYVFCLNASQPLSSTITKHHNYYAYK